MKRVVDSDAGTGRAQAGHALHGLLKLTRDAHGALVILRGERDIRPRNATEIAHQGRKSGERTTRLTTGDGTDRGDLRLARTIIHNHPQRPFTLRHNRLGLRDHHKAHAIQRGVAKIPLRDREGHRDLAKIMGGRGGRILGDARTQKITAARFHVLAIDRPRGSHECAPYVPGRELNHTALCVVGERQDSRARRISG